MIKICTYSINGNELVGVVANSSIIGLNAALKNLDNSFRADSVKELLVAGKAGLEAVKAVYDAGFCDEEFVCNENEVKLLAPIPNPGKFMCLAGNYMTHLAEHQGKADVKDVKRPTDIHVFTKVNTSLNGPYDDVVIPKSVKKLDYELELGFVIGKKGRYIPEDKAKEHIAGFFVANDISDRDFMPQVTGGRIHWFAMKARDYTAPFGPYLLLNEKNLHLSDLAMKLYVNGDLRQSVNPQEMVFKPNQIVSRLSSWVTLEPGDIIITGTPAGDSWSRNLFLRDGDVIEAGMEKVGSIKNRIRFEDEIYKCD